MPRWAKVVLVVFVVLLVIAGTGAVFAARWLRTKAAEMRVEGKATVAEAREFGRGRDAEECVAEALVRLRLCGGFVCEAKTKIFLSTCLGEAEVPAGFCDGVPDPAEIFAAATWLNEECARRGMKNSQRCARVIGGIQDYCYGE